MAEKKAALSKKYTADLDAVIRDELKFIEESRKKRRDDKEYQLDNSLPPEKQNLWGLAISGGGIRAATTGLGMLQHLIKRDLLKKFDYLSTVSGGGYIGSCLTTLLSRDETDRDGQKYGVSESVGINPDNSPFVGLDDTGEDRDEAKVRMGVRHQIHHLRSHGEYLIRNKSILSRDFQRAIGTFFSGFSHHLVMYLLMIAALVATIHFTIFTIVPENGETRANTLLTELNYSEVENYKISERSLKYLEVNGVSEDVRNKLALLKDQLFYRGEDAFLEKLDETVGSAELDSSTKKLILTCTINRESKGLEYVTSELRTWAYSRIGVPLVRMFYGGLENRPYEYLFFALLGGIWVTIAVSLGNWGSKKVTQNQEVIESLPSGYDAHDFYEARFIRRFNWSSVFSVTALVWVYGTMLSAGWLDSLFERFDWLNTNWKDNSLAILFMPLGFAIGGKTAAVLVIHLREVFGKNHSRSRRSLHNGIHGATFYGIIVSVALPILLVFVFSLEYFDFRFWWSLLSLLVGYFLLQGGVSKDSMLIKFAGRYYRQILTLMVAVIITISFSTASEVLLANVYPELGMSFLQGAGWVLLITTGIMIFLGMLVDANRVSPHYFYRDRLSETYFKTDARVKRNDLSHKQGMPQVTLRNNERLKLKDLGNTYKGPYHLIVAALNLQGTQELVRKTMQSDHFIFSPLYVGSSATGYVKTKDYRSGRTKVARAVAISGAAASSAMGLYSFWAQAFLATLFNIRLGFWMANPWFYCKDDKMINPEKNLTFWPKFLFRELFGLSDARDRRVNVSDGGHTGDNLGIFPLLQRRCKTIVVCDFEEDRNYSFESFNHAVRMAFVEENIQIDIRLEPLKPVGGDEEKSAYSEISVVSGKIFYPEGTTGELVYIKAALSEPDNMNLPVHIKNYLQANPQFPHQSTVGDQFFDDAQFEAYRALGEYITGQAVDYLVKAD